MLAFTADKLLTPREIIAPALLLVDEGRIVDVRCGLEIPSNASPQRFSGCLIAPGYIDLHIHGGGGFDVMSESADALTTVGRVIAKHGVTAYFPTTVTAPVETILHALERLADAIESPHTTPDARPLGIHLEGPFISHARRGVHPPENLLPPTIRHFDQFWQAARGHIKMMTIAPELDGGEEVIAEAARRGVCVSIGHSDADFATATASVAGGATHATHTFNAMRPLDHRNPGILGAVLTDSRLSADIIADGIHLDPAIVRLFAHAKGPHNTVLITDGTAATGMPDGRYRLGSMDVDVKDGRCVSDGKLAGSVLTMDRAVQNLARFADWELPLAIAAATQNPARVASLRKKGVLTPGADADFVVLTPEGHVRQTFVAGVAG